MKTKTATVRHSCRQAISTRYIRPENSQGARIEASAEVGALIVPWDYSLSRTENHAKAAQAFADKWGWGGRWIGGSSPDGAGYVFVNISEA